MNSSCVQAIFCLDFLWLLKRISSEQISLWQEVAQGLKGPPWTQLHPFSHSPSLGTLSGMPVLTPTCLLFGMFFYFQQMGQLGLNMTQDVFLFFLKRFCFSHVFFFSISATQPPSNSRLSLFCSIDILRGEKLNFPKGFVIELMALEWELPRGTVKIGPRWSSGNKFNSLAFRPPMSPFFLACHCAPYL